MDLDPVWEMIHLTSLDKTRRMDLAGLRDEVDSRFRPESLAAILGPPSTETETIGHDWLARAGKRWRARAQHRGRRVSERPVSDRQPE